MAWKITINCESCENLALACEEVAKEIEEGYSSGIVGYSGDTWYLEEV